MHTRNQRKEQDYQLQFKHSTYLKELRIRAGKKKSQRLLLLIILLQLAFIYSVFGQLMTNNNAAITNSAMLTIKGDMLNNAGTTIANSGTIALSGNWTNNSGNNCFGSSAGTLVLNGSGQSIGGSNETVFNNLILQGTGIKTLNQDATIGGGYAGPAGILTLNDRILDLNSHQLTIRNPAPAAISRTSGFVQSETAPVAGYSFLSWKLNNAPAGSVYEFPFGNISTNDYIPFIFSVTTPGSPTSEGSIAVASYPTDAFQLPNNRPLPSGVNALKNISGTENADKVVDRFWLIHASNYLTPPVATLQFTYRNDDFWNGNNSINEANLQAQKLNGNAWSFPMMGWDVPSVNTVSVPNASQYDTIWVLTDNTAPLPVTLLSFDAAPKENKSVQCSWVTATEINNDYFSLERSRNGSDFETIATIDGAGNSSSLISYYFTDEHPYQGMSYYRIKQTDFDGRTNYSETRVIVIQLKGIRYFAYPNPASTYLKLLVAGERETSGVIRITDALGRVVHEQPFSFEDDEQQIQIGISHIPSGNYQLQVFTTEQVVQQKISILH